jgi:hypothetical protein
MDKEYKNRINDQIDSDSKSFSKTELLQRIADLEYQLREIKNHGLGDSDAALTEWRIERDLKIELDLESMASNEVNLNCNIKGLKK